MSSDITVQITCPHCEKTHRFTMVPEEATGKETGVDCSHQTRTPEAFADKIRGLKSKPDERTAAIRNQLADLKDKDEKDHAPELSKKQRSRLLSKHLKGRSASTHKPKTSALLGRKLAQVSPVHNKGAMLAGKGLAQ